MIKTGKSNIEMLSLKKDFFERDEKLLKNQLNIGEFYKKQPIRIYCKNCNKNLEGVKFTKQNVNYTICKNCSHLNGQHEDTDEFCDFMYSKNEGLDYSKNYIPKDYETFLERVNQIYNPKVEFLINSLKEKNEEFLDMSFGDFGCGNGYLLKSLQNYGINNLVGFEVSETFVKNGNILLGNEVVKKIDINNYLNVVKNVDVLSLIGVLEHIQQPREFLKNLKNIKGLRYLYISVPTHSFSSYLETFSQNHFSRQLGSGHTHLYTDNSLKYIEKEFGLERISEWWFGTDMLDLFRHFSLDLDKKNLSEEFKNYFIELIDSLQLEIDKQKKSSEVHLLYKII